MMSLQTLAQLVPKIQRRMPGPIAAMQGWAHGQDRLYASHWLSAVRRHEVDRVLAACRTPRDYFDFAARFCPAHQIPFEILAFLELAASIEPRTVVEIGTAEGGTNFLLGAALPTVTLKIAVDLFVRNTRLLQAFGRTACRQLFINGSSYDLQTVRKVQGRLETWPIDVLFIDGDRRSDRLSRHRARLQDPPWPRHRAVGW